MRGGRRTIYGDLTMWFCAGSPDGTLTLFTSQRLAGLSRNCLLRDSLDFPSRFRLAIFDN